MWVANIDFNERTLSGQKGLFGSRTKKFNITFYGYPVSSHRINNDLYVTIFGSIKGDGDNVKKYIVDLKKCDRILNIENKNNFLTIQVKDLIDNLEFYNPNIIHLRPAMILPTGRNNWLIGSWDRKNLINFIEFVTKNFEGKLYFLKEKTIGSISIVDVTSKDLTKKQENAFDLALKNGYYDYPRKINVNKLAIKSNLAFSTYQVHLRKAESKLLPKYFQFLK